MHWTLNLILIIIIVHISQQVNENSDNINQILEHLIQGTKNADKGDDFFVKLFKNHNLIPTLKNESNVIYVKTVVKPNIIYKNKTKENDIQSTSKISDYERSSSQLGNNDVNQTLEAAYNPLESDITVTKKIVLEVKQDNPVSYIVEGEITTLMDSVARSGRPENLNSFDSLSANDFQSNNNYPLQIDNTSDDHKKFNHLKSTVSQDHHRSMDIISGIQKPFESHFKPPLNLDSTKLLQKQQRVELPVIPNDKFSNHVIYTFHVFPSFLCPIFHQTFASRSSREGSTVVDPFLAIKHAHLCCGSVPFLAFPPGIYNAY